MKDNFKQAINIILWTSLVLIVLAVIHFDYNFVFKVALSLVFVYILPLRSFGRLLEVIGEYFHFIIDIFRLKDQSIVLIPCLFDKDIILLASTVAPYMYSYCNLHILDLKLSKKDIYQR